MRRLLLSSVLLALAACGESGTQAANVVQAATRGAAEAGQQLAEKAAELAVLTPEEAKHKLQELVDLAASELRAVKDSETAQRVAAEIQRVLEQLGVFAARISEKLNVAGIQDALEDLLQRCKDDPRVVATLKALQEKLSTLAR
jgi:uncharacterized Ntn-hydrolase superfamily protein